MLASIAALSPIKVNPFISIILTLLLAFVPHFYKQPFVFKKLKESKTKRTVANSRQQDGQCVDNTELGMKIAACNGCHQNGLEALMIYSISVLSALVAHLSLDLIQGVAGIFLIARTAYTVAYLSSLNGPLRSVAWFAGLLLCLGLLYSASTKY